MREKILILFGFFFLMPFSIISLRAEAMSAMEEFELPKNDEEAFLLRDPFRRPIQEVQQRELTELERFPTTDFKMLAVVTGPRRLRAMILAPDGKTHFVSTDEKIGTRDGVVKNITHDSIEVAERIVNAIGQEERVTVAIYLDKED
jgi:Tfp pilus assembly protein PilP